MSFQFGFVIIALFNSVNTFNTFISLYRNNIRDIKPLEETDTLSQHLSIKNPYLHLYTFPVEKMSGLVILTANAAPH